MSLMDAGWARYAPETTPDNLTGRVALVHRDRFVVWTEDGEVTATASGHLRHSDEDQPCVGDWVTLRDGCVISAVLPRRTKLSRKEPGRRASEQVLAANMDVLFVVSGLDGDYNPRRLERYLVLAHESGARPVVLLNKADLRADLDEVVRSTESVAVGVLVLAVSAITGAGMDSVSEQVGKDETAALIGSSGVGKSAIVNAFLGEERQQTLSVRESDSKGRHTTTHRELIRMPGEWLLMDLPGVREVQLWSDAEGVDDAFEDIAELAAQCRFRDCSHEGEPGCAVRDGGLDPMRLRSYHKLKREASFLERQTDWLLAKETRKKWNAIEKEVRRHPKRLS
jgi:ribosome biogenesis GTPase